VDEFRVHGAVLGAGKYLVENIKDAHLLPPAGSFVGVFLLKIKEASESPIRLVGFIP
jgi:kynurenine formamidase